MHHESSLINHTGALSVWYAITAYALACLHDQSVEGGIFVFFSWGHLMLHAMENDVG